LAKDLDLLNESCVFDYFFIVAIKSINNNFCGFFFKKAKEFKCYNVIKFKKEIKISYTVVKEL